MKSTRCKDIHDRALALEHYERLAKNVEAEDRCYQIRWRAANKAGELLKAMEKAKGGGDRKSAEYHRSGNSTGDPSSPKTLEDLHISKQQSSDWQKLAAVPKDEFEHALAAKSVRELIDKPIRVSSDALSFIGTLRVFGFSGFLLMPRHSSRRNQRRCVWPRRVLA